MNIKNQQQEHEISSLIRKEMQGSVSIGKADMLQLRHWIVEMVEELKVKRKVVVAAEARAELLAEQLLSLQIQKDNQEQAARQREEKLEQSMVVLKQECEDQLKAMGVKNIQHQAQRESFTYIQEKTRTETRQLKTTIRQKEKQLRELEAQLQTEKSASSKLFSQWKETEVKLEELSQLHQICQKSLARLEEAVSVACETNRKLSYKQEQHSSAMLQKTKQLAELEAQLVKARVQISERPLETVDIQRAEARVEELQRQVVQLKRDKAGLEEQLEQDWARRKKAISQLETAQGLIGHHLENATKNRQEADRYRQQCSDLIGQHDHVTQQLSDMTKQLQEQQQKYGEARDQWSKEKIELEENLSAATHTLDVVERHKEQLENQTRQVMEERERLQAHLHTAKAKLDVPRTDQYVQAGCSVDHLYDASVQARVESGNILTQTEAPPGMRVASSQTPPCHMTTKMCQTVQLEDTVTQETQTATLDLIHVGTSTLVVGDPLHSHRHVGLQTDLFSDAGRTESLGTGFGDYYKDRNSSRWFSQRKSLSNNMEDFPSDLDYRNSAIRGAGYDLIGRENQKLARQIFHFNPLNSELGEQRLLQHQFSRQENLMSIDPENQTKTSKSIHVCESSMWQHISSPGLHSQPRDGYTGEGQEVVEKVTDPGPTTEKLGATCNDVSIKQELVENNEKISPGFHQLTSTVQQSSSLPQNVTSRPKRVPKYPHLLFADPFPGEEIGDKNTECSKSSCIGTKLDEISDRQVGQDTQKSTWPLEEISDWPIGKETQKPPRTLDETARQGVELYRSDFSHVLRSRWNVYSKQCTSKQDLDSPNPELDLWNPTSSSSTQNNLLLHSSVSHAQSLETASLLNKGIKIEHSDHYHPRHLDREENRSCAIGDQSTVGSYHITSFSSPQKPVNNSEKSGLNNEVSCDSKSPRRKKVFKSLCLSKTAIAPTPGRQSSSSIQQRSGKVLPDSVQESQDTGSLSLPASGLQELTETTRTHQAQEKQWQQRAPQHEQYQEKQPLSADFKSKNAEDNLLFPANDKTKESRNLGDLLKSEESSLDSTVTVTSPARVSNRSIFKSSQARPSLQETISAFKSSPRSRHLLGAPVSKLSSSKSRAVAKVNPLNKSPDRDKCKQWKDKTTSRVTENWSKPQARKHQAYKQSKGNNSEHSKRQRQEQSPLFSPNITKLYGYSAHKSDTLPKPSIVSKGILKAPQSTEGSSLSTKSVHFPEQLEIHMKGLTQESQESPIHSQTEQAERSVVSSMFQLSLPSPVLPQTRGLQPSSNRELPFHNEGNSPSVKNGSNRVTDKGSNSTVQGCKTPCHASGESGSASFPTSLDTHDSHANQIIVSDKTNVSAVDCINGDMTELDSTCPKSPPTTCSDFNQQHTATGTDDVPKTDQYSNRSVDGVTRSVSQGDERLNLVIPETPNLSAVVDQSSQADLISDPSTQQQQQQQQQEEKTLQDQPSVLPPDCKKLKLGSP